MKKKLEENILIEVNVAEEESKFGVSVADTEDTCLVAELLFSPEFTFKVL